MSTIQEDQEDLARCARKDRENHIRHRVSLNPFSTVSARWLWDMGWNGKRPDNLVDQSQNWRYWERGRQARLLHDHETTDC